MAPWWALVVGLISGLVFLCLSVVSIALCCSCVRKKKLNNQSGSKEKLEDVEDPETASNNNEKAYINHAIIHDEYSVPIKRNTSPSDLKKDSEKEEDHDKEEDSPEVPPKLDDTDNLDDADNSDNSENHVEHKKQNGVRWKETPEIINAHDSYIDDGKHTLSDSEHENEVFEADERDHDHTDEKDYDHTVMEHNDEEEEEENGDKEQNDDEEEENDMEHHGDTDEAEHAQDEIEETDENPEDDEEQDNEGNDDDDDEENHESQGNDDDDDDTGLATASVTAVYLEPSKVSLIRLVREGVFGVIYKGEIEIDGKDRIALIKTFAENSTYTEKQKTEFLQQGTMLYSLDHKNVLAPYGITEKRDMPIVVYPEANLLDLKSYIIDPHHTLSVRHMLDYSLNIAEAMACLHKHDIVHKDLAARNCWITDTKVIKVCDGALAPELFPEDYETTHEIKSPMPIRWMAPECLTSGGNFTKFSDVWAYGILIWELFKRGEHRPYWELPAQKVYNNVIDGDVLIKPFFAPDKVYDLIRSCWEPNPDDRPTFDDIIKTFQNEIYKRTSGRKSSILST